MKDIQRGVELIPFIRPYNALKPSIELTLEKILGQKKKILSLQKEPDVTAHYCEGYYLNSRWGGGSLPGKSRF